MRIDARRSCKALPLALVLGLAAHGGCGGGQPDPGGQPDGGVDASALVDGALMADAAVDASVLEADADTDSYDDPFVFTLPAEPDPTLSLDATLGSERGQAIYLSRGHTYGSCADPGEPCWYADLGRQNSLITQLGDNGFETVILYRFGAINDRVGYVDNVNDASGFPWFDDFAARLNLAGVRNLCVAVSSDWAVGVIAGYNALQSEPDRRIKCVRTEFEFWPTATSYADKGYCRHTDEVDCDRRQYRQYFDHLLDLLEAYRPTVAWTEVYLGYPHPGPGDEVSPKGREELRAIAYHSDVVALHYYVNDLARLPDYKLTRLQTLQDIVATEPAISAQLGAIYSAECSFLGPDSPANDRWDSFAQVHAVLDASRDISLHSWFHQRHLWEIGCP